MVYFNLHQIAHNLKIHVKSWNANKLVFSYDLKIITTKTGLTLCLYQRETNFSIFMDMEEQRHCLRVNRLAMTEDAYLEQVSDALYDAATIELVLQALNLVFFCAEHQNHEETIFILTDEEVNHLNVIKSCFEEISSYATVEGKRIFLTLLTSSDDYNTFIEHLKIVTTRVLQELWKRQRTDPLIGQCLQNPRHPLTPAFLGLKEDMPDFMANVIAFPKLVHQR